MKPKTKLIAGLIVVFLAGGVIGSVATSLMMKNRMGLFKRGGAEQRVERIVGRISGKLDLTEDQKVKVSEILLADMKDEGPNRAERFKARLERRWAKIQPLLTAEQKVKLEEHKQKVLDRIEKKFRQ